MLHVTQGSSMPPTGELELYPFQGLLACTQTLDLVGIGTQVVEAGVVLVVLVVLALVLAAGQAYTELETVGGD